MLFDVIKRGRQKILLATPHKFDGYWPAKSLGTPAFFQQSTFLLVFGEATNIIKSHLIVEFFVVKEVKIQPVK